MKSCKPYTWLFPDGFVGDDPSSKYNARWLGIVILLFTMLLLIGCSDNSSPPAVGQWQQNCNATIGGNVMTFPSTAPGACYLYTALGKVPKVGQTLTINYSLSGNPTWVQNGASGGNPQGDINPPTIHLLLYRNADNGSCAGAYNFYRLFTARTDLVIGNNQTVSAVLDPTQWIGCYGAVDAASFTAALNDLYGAGVTFGGQYFAGHGIYVSPGSATFRINGFGVQ